MSGWHCLEVKAQRAEEQLDELNRKVSEFIQDPYTITCKDNDKKIRHVKRYEVKPLLYPIPMLAGEFAYSLRSGLDQLAWQLARLHVKPKRPRTATCFPIFRTPPDPKRGFGDKTRDILPAALPVIESLQPYQRGARFKDHPLYALNELCILDKHMTIPVNCTSSQIRISGADYTHRDLDHGFEVTVHLTDKYKVQLQPMRTEIIFGEPIGSPGGGFEIRIATFRTIYDFVRNDVLPRFTSFFK
jgi:hypothetical protein